MDFTDFTWDEIEGTFVKENILGSEFSFSPKHRFRFLSIIFQKFKPEKFRLMPKNNWIC